MQPARLWKRAIAGIIDCLLASVLSLIPLVGFLLGLIYIFLRDGFIFTDTRGSLGKSLMNLRIVDDNGKEITQWTPMLKRNVTMILPIISLVDIIVPLFDKQRRRFGDRWAKTFVVEN